jgi:hypothetical protein
MATNIRHVAPTWRGTLADLANATDAVLGVGAGVRVGDLVAIEPGGGASAYLARVTSAETPAVGLISYAAAVTLPGGTAEHDVLYIGAGPAFARSGDLGYNAGAATFRAPIYQRKVSDAGLLTPSGTPVTWQPSIVAGIITATANADITINKPTTSVPAGYVEADLIVTSTHTTRTLRVLLGTLTWAGLPGVLYIPPLGTWRATVYTTDGGANWRLKGRNGALVNLDFSAPAPAEDASGAAVLMEIQAPLALWVSPALLSLAVADCSVRQSGAGEVRLQFQQWTGAAWQTIQQCTFPGTSAGAAQYVGTWAHVLAPTTDDAVIPAGRSYRFAILGTAAGGTGPLGITNVRGRLWALA